jgi:hypothetical protein
MKRRIVALVMLGACCVLSANWSAREIRAEKKTAGRAGFVHTVIFYLKKDVPESTVDTIIADARDLLVEVPTVRGLKVGRRSEKSNGERNDKEFQIGLLVLFDGYDGLQEYNVHPKHKEFVARHLKSFEKIAVFDFEDTSK